MSSQSLQ